MARQVEHEVDSASPRLPFTPRQPGSGHSGEAGVASRARRCGRVRPRCQRAAGQLQVYSRKIRPPHPERPESAPTGIRQYREDLVDRGRFGILGIRLRHEPFSRASRTKTGRSSNSPMSWFDPVNTDSEGLASIRCGGRAGHGQSPAYEFLQAIRMSPVLRCRLPANDIQAVALEH